MIQRVVRIWHSFLLTVQPLGVVFECSLVAELLAASRQVVQVSAEDDGIGLGELCVRTAVECREFPRVAMLNPHSRGVVIGIVGTLGDPIANTGNVLAAVKVRQI